MPYHELQYQAYVAFTLAELTGKINRVMWFSICEEIIYNEAQILKFIFVLLLHIL